jgi:hypothetical protein
MINILSEEINKGKPCKKYVMTGDITVKAWICMHWFTCALLIYVKCLFFLIKAYMGSSLDKTSVLFKLISCGADQIC